MSDPLNSIGLQQDLLRATCVEGEGEGGGGGLIPKGENPVGISLTPGVVGDLRPRARALGGTTVIT